MNKYAFVFQDSSYYLLVSLISLAMFFILAMFRKFKESIIEGILYAVISLFFITAHFFYLHYIPVNGNLSYFMTRLDMWHWLVYIFSPALIFIFLVIGLYNLVMNYIKIGMTKLFFGLTLLCYLFMLGSIWPDELKGIITIFFLIAWFELELRTVNQK